MKLGCILSALMVVGAFSPSAFAQTSSPTAERMTDMPSAAPAARPQAGPPAQEGFSLTVGFAPVFSPIYEGADDYGLSVFPDFRVAYGSRFTLSVPDGARLRIVETPRWQAGPVARLRFGRDGETGASPFLITGETDDLAGFDDIDIAVELGAFAQRTGFFGDPRAGSGWRLNGEVRQGIGAHEAVIGEASASVFKRFGKTIVTGGPRLSIGTSDYTRVYFGVAPDVAQATGLNAFAADGTYVTYGVGATAIRSLNSRVTATLFTRYERIAGEAADSPIVADLGSADQFSLGLAFGYRF